MQLSELVDIDELKGLCESFTAQSGAVTAILDLEGNILIATGWQDICTCFHRINPLTAQRCRESDTILAGQLRSGEYYNVYKCKNGLVDVAVPLVIEGEHIANFFTGQFFFEPPDREYFIRQAEECGFEKESYLEALKKVPIFSEYQTQNLMKFFSHLTQLFGKMGLAQKRLNESLSQLQESKQQLNFHVDNSPMATVEWDSNFVVTRWAGEAEKIFGWTSLETLGKPIMDLQMIFEEDLPVIQNTISQLVSGSSKYVVATNRNYTKERRLITCEWYNTVVRNSQGHMVSVLSQVLDITERTKTEAALRYKLSELDAIYTHTPMMMCLVDSDRRILYANPAFRVIQGFSEEELVGGHACGVFGCVNAKDDPQGCGYGTQCRDCTLLKAIEDTFQTGTGHSNEEHFITVNYKENQRNFTFLGSTVLIYSGEQRHLLLSLLDISELKKAEEQKLELEKQLFQAQKLESLGVLAGGIAHDFNNILAIIVGNCFLAKMYPDAAENNLSTIEKASERAAELCRQMLAYAGKNQFIEEHVNFGGLVDEMITMLKATISQNIVINFFCTDDIPLLKADSSQLRQIVMNLIINAVEAIGDAHGEILITLTKTAVKSRKEDKDHLGKTIPAGSYICLKVTDDGCGMDEENTRRIFEPFYSTKFTGRGLGMSAVLGIITAHKGALQLVSQPGLGTTFKIFLPVESIYLAGSDYPEHPSSLEEAQ